MNVTYDVLNVILSYTQQPECVLVCKYWYNLIKQNGHTCLKCKKITKIYDHDIWTTDTYDKMCHLNSEHYNKFIHSCVDLVDITLLKNVMKKLVKLFSEINIIFENENDKQFIRIKELSYDKSDLIDIKFNENYFDKFICRKNKIIIGVNAKRFNNYLNNFSDNTKVRLSCRIDNKSTLSTLHIGTILNDNVRAEIPYKLYDLPINNVTIPQITFDMICTMDTNDFNDVCRRCPKNTKIICTEDTINFISNDLKLEYDKVQNKIAKQVEMIDNFDLKNLSLFSNKDFCDSVDIYMKNDFPICIIHNIQNYGKVMIMTVPKKN